MFNFCLKDFLQMIGSYSDPSSIELKCYTIAGFQRLISSDDDEVVHSKVENFWQKYVQTVFQDTGITIDSDQDEICATAVSKKFLLKIFSWIKDIPTDDLELLIWYKVFVELAYYTGEYFREVKSPRYLFIIQM
jgi:wyosine [tRNA(Phe)-imidazoG37] synthetase (radical SAM superfamily)